MYNKNQWFSFFPYRGTRNYIVRQSQNLSLQLKLHVIVWWYQSYWLPFAFIRNVPLDFFVRRKVKHQNPVNLVSIATVLDKQNVSFAQKVSNVKTLHQNPQLVQRACIVLRVMQHVQSAQRGMSVLMVHHPGCALKDSLHPSVPQPARPVLLVIDALVKECLPRRAVLKDNTQTRPHN